MNGAPGAVSYNYRGRQQLYAFVGGQNGNLYLNYYHVPSHEWKWQDQGRPQSNVAVSSGAEAVVANLYNRSGHAREMIYAFVTGNDGRLYANIWDEVDWRWEECNTPNNLRLGSRHSAAVYQDAGLRLDDIRVFVHGDRTAPRGTYPELWEARYDLAGVNPWTYSWTWENRGTHPNVSAIASNPGALKQLPYPQLPTGLYAFVRGTDNRLYMHYQSLSPPFPTSWHDQNVQQSVTVAGGPSVIRDSNEIYAFVRDDNGGLWANHGNYGAVTNFSWHNYGHPANQANVLDEPGVVTYTWRGQSKIYAFVRDDDGNLHVNHGVGTNGKWAELGTPTGTKVSSAPGVVTHVHDNVERIYVFVWGDDGKLHVCFWDEPQQRWCWRRQGAQWLNDPGGDVRCL